MPTELMKDFIGKVCTIVLFNESFGITGKIVAVEVNSSTNKHILHIKFVKIDKTTRNSIYSLIYNY